MGLASRCSGERCVGGNVCEGGNLAVGFPGAVDIVEPVVRPLIPLDELDCEVGVIFVEVVHLGCELEHDAVVLNLDGLVGFGGRV